MSDEQPRKLSPVTIEAIDIQWVTSNIGWPFPVWVDKTLFADEFHDRDEAITASRLVAMFNNLGLEIDKAFAGDRVSDTIRFKYWRKISDKATKMKPVQLNASLYVHPDYDRIWMLVEYAQ